MYKDICSCEVPPIMSGFPDLGPDPDYFEQTSPVFTISNFDLSSLFIRRSNQIKRTAPAFSINQYLKETNVC